MPKQKECACATRGSVKVIFIGMTDDIYTVDFDADTVELDNDLSEDQDTVRVKCEGCDVAWDFNAYDLDDAIEEATGTVPQWVVQALEKVRDERGG